MAVTDTGQVKTCTTEWAIYAALKQGGTIMSTDGLDDLVDATWDPLPDSCSFKHVSVKLSVWINDRTGLVFIGLDGDLDIPATATAEGVLSLYPRSSVALAVGLELLGVGGEGHRLHAYTSTLVALNDALEDWADNLKAALEHY